MRVVILTTIALLACQSVMTTPWEGMELIHPQAIPFPKAWQVQMHEIGSTYIRDTHDCDDMAQEFADYLHEWFSWDDMRLVYGEGMPFGAHMWLEVWWEGSWWVCDPSSDKLMWKFIINGRDSKVRPINWNCYATYIVYPASEAFLDGTGYPAKGSRFINGAWVTPTLLLNWGLNITIPVPI